ncbi:hypothetical protein CH63R_08632 [Colletotrichum higginsianum IMI 349063]|uniref:Uncharacterized protein n=1 Tax=Colletotrichum higginsianum (strain IMI 349063) TaxID=759273 RepID=A0A1B7Y500_COLHI|nr:hypothetical protein CH63R_08632 [Colletotrichum higginsianum IMI 349063]OBR07111.1 hypothetical protein CH63R_08632 [Colletotrichum higginsianum IMI 349063]
MPRQAQDLSLQSHQPPHMLIPPQGPSPTGATCPPSTHPIRLASPDTPLRFDHAGRDLPLAKFLRKKTR